MHFRRQRKEINGEARLYLASGEQGRDREAPDRWAVEFRCFVRLLPIVVFPFFEQRGDHLSRILLSIPSLG